MIFPNQFQRQFHPHGFQRCIEILFIITVEKLRNMRRIQSQHTPHLFPVDWQVKVFHHTGFDPMVCEQGLTAHRLFVMKQLIQTVIIHEHRQPPALFHGGILTRQLVQRLQNIPPRLRHGSSGVIPIMFNPIAGNSNQETDVLGEKNQRQHRRRLQLARVSCDGQRITRTEQNVARRQSNLPDHIIPANPIHILALHHRHDAVQRMHVPLQVWNPRPFAELNTADAEAYGLADNAGQTLLVFRV